jgi:thymidine kinase
LIIGPMFANKTMTLMAAVERCHYAKQRCVIVKHTIDTRYDHLSKAGGIICNNHIEYTTIPSITSTRLSDIDVSDYDVIGVTESQFFEDLLVVDQWANSGKIVICDGLDGDYHRDNFGQIHLLMPKCEQVTKLNAVCVRCYADACFTKKIDENIAGGGLGVIDIGASNKYYPVCRQCYFNT